MTTRTTRPKATRHCPLHGDVPHAQTLSRYKPDGSPLLVWKCMTCDNERSRVRADRKRRELHLDTRPGGRKPMAPLLAGVVRPASQTLSQD